MAVSGLLNRPVIHTPDDRAIPFYATMHPIIPIFQKYNKSAYFSNYKLDKSTFP